jgi:hypothetical protein
MRQSGTVEVTEEQIAHAANLVAHDLVATLGWAEDEARTVAEREARHWAEMAQVWDDSRASPPDMYTLHVAEEVQQWLQDTFVDTTWPACPEHPNHPLQLDETDDRLVWRCPRTGEAVAPLGGLRDRT